LNKIYHCFWIKVSHDKVYSALTDKEGLAGWWTKGIEGEGTPGGVLSFRFKSGAFNRMKIKSLQPDKIEWECVDGNTEWIGTQISFELRQENEQIKVCFSHYGWGELTEYVGECSFHWANYFVSLQKYCETGEGAPNEGV